MADRYPQVMRIVSETAWAIRPQTLAVIQTLLAMRARGERLEPAEIQARIGATPTREASPVASVAVIPIYGTILPRASMFSNISGGGGTGVDAVSAAFAQAVADDSIGAILLDVDSPGGSCYMIPEFASEIRDARGSKPIIAIANTCAASAAFWIASQADEVVVSPSGIVGSIGVYAAHEDISAQLEQDGIAMTLIKAGKFKAEGNPFEPLSDDAREWMQGFVDATYAKFVADVASGRGVSAETVRNGYGQGRVVTADDALAEGMVDEIATFEETVERLVMRVGTAPPDTRQVRASSDPPDTRETIIEDTRAAESGPSFVQAALALRDQADTFTADARALRVLTGAKRDALSAVAESLTGSAAALAELAADPDTAPLTSEQRAELIAIQRRWS